MTVSGSSHTPPLNPVATDPVHVDTTTAEERQLPFRCDRHFAAPDDAYFRAIDIDAPAPTVFRWLCQLRLAPYSYDWIDNFGRRSPHNLTPGLEDLRLGQRFMTIFDLVEYERDVHLTLAIRRLQRLFGGVVGAYLIRPEGAERSRLIVKLLVSHPGGQLESRLRANLLPRGDLVMMRKQLRTLKFLVEQTHHTSRADARI